MTTKISSDQSKLTTELAAAGGSGLVGYGAETVADILDERISGNDAKRYKIVSCVIRNTGAGWAYLEDSGHTAVQFTGTPEILTAPEDFKLRLPIINDTSKVVSVLVGPDETFALKGLSCGASVSTDEAVLQCSMPLKFRTFGLSAVGDVPTYFGSRVSIAPNPDNTGFVATVPNLQGASTSQVMATTQSNGGDGRGTEVRVEMISNTSFEVRSFSPLEGVVEWDSGTTFGVTTDNVFALSTAWNAGANTLTVNHGSCGKTNVSALLTRIDGAHEARLVSSTASNFVVKFYDDAGVLQTTPDASFKFGFARPFSTPCLMPANQRVYIDCGHALLYWADIIDANGNFWLIGMMEF